MRLRGRFGHRESAPPTPEGVAARSRGPLAIVRGVLSRLWGRAFWPGFGMSADIGSHAVPGAMKAPIRARSGGKHARRGGSVKAVVYEAPRQVSVKEVPDARIERPTDGLVRVTSANICGSDLHMYEGRTDFEPGRWFGLRDRVPSETALSRLSGS